MLKALLVNLLKLYVKEDEKSYSDYIVYLLIAIGLSILLIANYVYFFEASHKEIGRYLASGTLLMVSALFIQAINLLIKQLSAYKTMSKLNNAKTEIVDIGKQLNEAISSSNFPISVPTIFKYLPMSAATLLAFYLTKRKLFYKIK